MFEKEIVKNAVNILILVVLILGLLFVATKFGLMQCSAVPLWCDIYYAIEGHPRVLVVYGTDGLGDPDLLRDGLNRYSQVYAENLPLSAVGSENLKEFALVIVDHAKTMRTDQIIAFQKYVDGGGRLIWMGDAGTAAPEDEEFWYKDDADTNAAHEIEGAWVRKDKDGYKIDFGANYLSAEYIGNYCELSGVDCETSQPYAGTMWISSDPLTQGLKRDLTIERNFAVVKSIEGGMGTKLVAGINLDAAIKKDEKNYGTDFPLIIKTGVGGRVAYYAIPPEAYLDKEKGEIRPSILQNMYSGMMP